MITFPSWLGGSLFKRRYGSLFERRRHSDFYLEEFKLSEEQREALPALGWEWPSPPAKENWHFHDELMNTGSAISGLLVRTLRTVFHCDDNDPLEVLVFLSSNNK